MINGTWRRRPSSLGSFSLETTLLIFGWDSLASCPQAIESDQSRIKEDRNLIIAIYDKLQVGIFLFIGDNIICMNKKSAMDETILFLLSTTACFLNKEKWSGAVNSLFFVFLH